MLFDDRVHPVPIDKEAGDLDIRIILHQTPKSNVPVYPGLAGEADTKNG